MPCPSSFLLYIGNTLFSIYFTRSLSNYTLLIPYLPPKKLIFIKYNKVALKSYYSTSILSQTFNNLYFVSFFSNISLINLKSGGNAGLSICVKIVKFAPTSFAYNDASNADIVTPYPVTGTHKISAL